MTETALADVLIADLSELDLVALMIDGVHLAKACCIVALGINIDGVKHPLALVEGSTENATLVTDLLVDLRERCLDVTRPMLVGLDGSKGLRKAVLDVLDHPVIQRCQLHKIRNVKDHLPQLLRSSIGRKMTDAYRASSALEAEAALLALAAELDLPPKFHGTRDILPRGSISDSEKRSKITLKSCGSITFNCNVFRRPNLYRLEKYGLINRVIESKHVTRSHFATATLWRYRYALCGVMDCGGVDVAAVVQPG